MDTLRNNKRAPSQPSALLREVVLPELGITQGEFADRLGVSPGPCPKFSMSAARLRRTWRFAWARCWAMARGCDCGCQTVDVWTLEQQGDYAHVQQFKAA